MDTTTRRVVVGVDGSDENRGALRYAVEEARRTGGQLELVHVVPDFMAISPVLPGPADFNDIGQSVLAEAEAYVRIIAPDLEPVLTLRRGGRPSELIRAAEEASMLVVGRDDRPLVQRLVDGDTASRVASRATVPVVEVPPHWHEDGGEEHGVVLVGMKSPDHAPSLARAFAAAQARSARLLILHAWHLPSGYDDIIEARVAREQVQREGTAEIERAAEDWRTTYPDVEVEPRVLHDRAARALVEASKTADLIVLVRRGHGAPAVGNLGGTARAVLRNAECPVMIVPPTDGPLVADLVLEAEGQLLR